MRIRGRGAATMGSAQTTDIGAKLRALYGAVQEEADSRSKLLDLLEKLDQAEQQDRQ